MNILKRMKRGRSGIFVNKFKVGGLCNMYVSKIRVINRKKKMLNFFENPFGDDL